MLQENGRCPCKSFIVLTCAFVSPWKPLCIKHEVSKTQSLTDRSKAWGLGQMWATVSEYGLNVKRAEPSPPTASENKWGNPGLYYTFSKKTPKLPPKRSHGFMAHWIAKLKQSSRLTVKDETHCGMWIATQWRETRQRGETLAEYRCVERCDRSPCTSMERKSMVQLDGERLHWQSVWHKMNAIDVIHNKLWFLRM